MFQSLRALSRVFVLLLAVFTAIHRDPADVFAAAPERRTENVLLVTFDGFRWQELFTGADESLINKEFGGVKRIEETHERYWRPTPEERRQVLLPFFWSKVAVEGKVYGNPEHQSVSRVTNG